MTCFEELIDIIFLECMEITFIALKILVVHRTTFYTSSCNICGPTEILVVSDARTPGKILLWCYHSSRIPTAMGKGSSWPDKCLRQLLPRQLTRPTIPKYDSQVLSCTKFGRVLSENCQVKLFVRGALSRNQIDCIQMVTWQEQNFSCIDYRNCQACIINVYRTQNMWTSMKSLLKVI